MRQTIVRSLLASIAAFVMTALTLLAVPGPASAYCQGSGHRSVSSIHGIESYRYIGTCDGDKRYKGKHKDQKNNGANTYSTIRVSFPYSDKGSAWVSSTRDVWNYKDYSYWSDGKEHVFQICLDNNTKNCSFTRVVWGV